MSLVMSNHRGGRRPRRRGRCPSSEERGVPGITGDGVGGDDRAPRSEESPVSLAMTEHRGARSPRAIDLRSILLTMDQAHTPT